MKKRMSPTLDVPLIIFLRRARPTPRAARAWRDSRRLDGLPPSIAQRRSLPWEPWILPSWLSSTMSQENNFLQPVTDNLPDAPAATPAKQSVRSFKYNALKDDGEDLANRPSRKKYAKMKVKYELGTRESDNLIREELRIEDLSKRIQEQNEYAIFQNIRMAFGLSLIVSPVNCSRFSSSLTRAFMSPLPSGTT